MYKYIVDVLLKFYRCNFGCLLDDYIKEGKREFVKKIMSFRCFNGYVE